VIAEPNGCRHCGIPERRHYQQWEPPVGWHAWAQPTDSQILVRMQARRAARATNSLKDKAMSMPPALATIAALHTLLTERPELAALPIRWSVESDGALHTAADYRSPEGHAAMRALAEALGVDTHESKITSSSDGVRLSVLSLHHTATIAGVQVYGNAYLPVSVLVEDGAL
jgi:hypothetical protein